MIPASFRSRRMNPPTSVFAMETRYEYITVRSLGHVFPAEFVEGMKV